VNVKLKLPKDAFVNKFIPKNKFYEKATLNSKLQKEFVDKIQKITWKYKLAESTVGISRTDNIIEIQIFEIELKEQKIPQKALQVIDRAIPYPILYCFVFNESAAYGITLKQDTGVENYYFSDWDEEMLFDFTGIDLEKVYQKLVKAFIRNEAQSKSSFNEIVDVDKRIKTLENEILALEKKISKEKQFNRKVEINKILLEKKAELKNIKGEVR